MEYRPATARDIDYIMALEERCMRGYAEALWGRWDVPETRETFRLEGHEIVAHDGAVAGCVAALWRKHHLFVEKLYIEPQFQGLGLGAQILRDKTALAAASGLPTRLSVLITNPRAEALYRREGFIVEHETPERRFMVYRPG